MLKDLLRSLIESVFTSKKSYISAQAFPGNVTRTNLGLDTTGTFIAPSDGYFGFYINGTNAVDVYFHNQANSIAIRTFFGQTTVFNNSQTIPVSKGCRVTYSFGATPTEIWFFIGLVSSTYKTLKLHFISEAMCLMSFLGKFLVITNLHI